MRIFFAALLCAASAFGASWKAGVASVDITPEKPVWMAGFAARKLHSQGVEQRLYSKALALDDGSGKRCLLISTDLLGLNRAVAGRIAAEIGKRYGIPRERLLLNSSHTHSGPVIEDMLAVAYDLTPQQWKDIEVYTAWMEKRIVESAGRALQKLQPVQLRFGHASAGFAANRRTALNPNGPVDHDVPVLRVDNADGTPFAIVYGYACHNTAITAGNVKINGDYAGYASAALERAHPKATALFVTGCGADQNAAPRGTPELAKQHGETLAAAVLGSFSSMKPVSGPLKAAFGIAELPFATPPDRAELVKRLDDTNEFVRRHARLLLRNLDTDGKLATTYPDPIQVWRFGDDVTLIAMGGEVVVDYALRLKKEFGGNVWAAGYSNDVFGYVPSLRVLKEGGYEGGGAMIYYGQTGPFAEDVEETIFRKIRELLATAGG